MKQRRWTSTWRRNLRGGGTHQIELDVIQALTLTEVVIVCRCQEPAFVPSHNALCMPISASVESSFIKFSETCPSKRIAGVYAKVNQS